jgi:hypothetical protein
VDDLYLVRMRARPGSKDAFHAAVEHVGTRERHHFDSVRDLIAFFERRCVDGPDEPPQALDENR